MTDNERRYQVTRYSHFLLVGDELLYCTKSHRPSKPTTTSHQTEAIALISATWREAYLILVEMFKARAEIEGFTETDIDIREIYRLVLDLRAEWEWVDD